MSIDWFASLPKKETPPPPKVHWSFPPAAPLTESNEPPTEQPEEVFDSKKFLEEYEARQAVLRAEHEERMKETRLAAEERMKETRLAAEEVKRLALSGIEDIKDDAGNVFDIIVYVNMHGACFSEYETVAKYTIEPPIGTTVSVMRSSDYGVISYGVSEEEVLPVLINDIMDVNPSKNAVFKGLQTMFRYIKKRNAARREVKVGKRRYDDMERESDGWNYKIDGGLYYQSFYSTDELFNTITVVYSSKGPLTVGERITLPYNSLRDLISYIHSLSYTNIGIIEHTCHSTWNGTARTNQSVHNRLKKAGINGGIRTKKNQKKTRIRRKKMSSKLLR